VARQRARLRLDEHSGITTAPQLGAFVAEVAIALRYGPNDVLPLASIYHAVWRHGPRAELEADAQRRATVLTNALLDAGSVIEVNVIADRLAIAHAAITPALIALRRRGRGVADLDLSDAARRVLELLGEHPRPTAGFVRARYGVPPKQWPNPADEALAELQRALVIDRGSTDVPDTGAAYLGKDGIPYRMVDVVHRAHVAAATALSVDAAAITLVGAYLDGAVFATRRRLASLFKRCVSVRELDAALAALAAQGRIDCVRIEGSELVVATTVR
jgi:hypothetical protein